MPPTGSRRVTKATSSATPNNHGAAEDAANSPERRKMRNRLSQRAFRARQAMRIQELESRLEQTTEPDSNRTIQLQEQNAKLREQLLRIYKKSTSIQISMKTLADEAKQALGIDVSMVPIVADEDDFHANHLERSSTPEPVETQGQEYLLETESVPDATAASEVNADSSVVELPLASPPDFVPAMNPFDPHLSGDSTESVMWTAPNLDFFSGFSESMQLPVIAEDHSIQLRGPSTRAFGSTASSDLIQMPLSTNFLGPEHYTDIWQRATTFREDLQMVKRTNSGFSDHIDAVEACLSSQTAQAARGRIANKQLLNAIEFMIKAFVNVSWTRMNAWETYTRTLTAVRDLTAWRMGRTMAEWEKIVPQYRPTKLQRSVAHPSVIDWIPWPSLRDKLIIHHSANPKLDELISNIGRAYVVQADLSTLVECSEPAISYVSVWMLVQAAAAGEDAVAQQGSSPWYPHCGIDAQPFAMSSSGVAQHDGTPCQFSKLPASSVNELFESVPLAKAALRLLRLDQGAAFNYRLDPTFFEKYPELYDHEANIIAQGMRLRPNSRIADEPYPVPGVLDSSVISQYRDLSMIALHDIAV